MRRRSSRSGAPGALRPLGERQHRAQLAADLVGAVAVGLVDDVEVADLEDARPWRPGCRRPCRAPAAPAWCRPGRRSRPRSGRRPRSRRGSTSQPAASSTRSACGRGPGEPAEVAARGHRADVDLGVERVVLHPDPVAEQRAAGERRGRVDREHADPLAGRAQLGRPARWSTSTCPTPGEPVMPTTWALPGVAAPGAAITSRSSGELVLDERDQPRDGARRHPRAPARRAPGRCRDGAGPDRPQAGTRMIRASPWPPPPHSAAAPMPPPRRFSSRARCSTIRAPDMPTGWPSAIAPPLTLTLSSETPSWRADSMPTAAKASLSSNRSMSETAMPSLLGGLLDGAGRLQLERGVGAGDLAGGADLGEPGEAELLGLGLAHHDDGAGAVGDLGGRAGGDGAVLGDRAQARRGDSTVVSPRTPSSSDDDDVALAAAGSSTGTTSSSKRPFFQACGGPLVRLGGERVLLLAGEVGAGGVAALGQVDHRLVGELVVERVVGHRVDQRGVAVLEALAATSAAGAGPGSSTPCRRRRRSRARRRGSAGRPSRSR